MWKPGEVNGDLDSEFDNEEWIALDRGWNQQEASKHDQKWIWDEGSDSGESFGPDELQEDEHERAWVDRWRTCVIYGEGYGGLHIAVDVNYLSEDPPHSI